MLNNHGWGMKDMIIYSCIILLFLLIATYYIRSFYKGISMSSPNTVEKDSNNGARKEVNYSLYRNYEQRMSRAAIDYVYQNYGSLDRSIASITLDDLISNGYIEPLRDQLDGSLCRGYTNVWDSEDNVLHASSYVKCSNYKTDGYIN